MRSSSVIYTVLLFLLFSGIVCAAVPIAENLTIAGFQSTDNLSASWDVYDGDADVVRNFTVWSLNGNELPVLYVPFEGSSNSYNATDYAGGDNGGSAVLLTPVYNPTGGYDGHGAYEFDSSNEQLTLSTTNFPPIGTGNYTLMAWIKTAGTQATYSAIFAINSYDPGFYIYSTNYLGVYDSGMHQSTYNSSLSDGSWHHVAFVREGTGLGQLKFYLDGRPLGTSQHSASINAPSILRVGYDGYSGEDFYGSIDDLRFYDYALSAEQVAAFAHNESNKIVSSMTSDGQNWSMCVTPNDGGQDGAAACSSNVTIGVAAATPVSSCQGISSSGEYALTSDLSGAISGSCIEITASDVLLDCQGYNITNNGTGGLTHGILVNGTTNVTIRNCSFVEDYDYGVRLVDTDSVTIDPSYFCDDGYGISLDNSNNTNINDSVACNNSVAGIYVVNSANTSITNSRMYNNSDDFKIIRSISAGMPLLMSNVTFDNPDGNLRNYTNIDLNDTLSISNEDYTLDWAASPASPPTGYESVKDKYLDITSSTSMSIDSITWNYVETDAFGFDESSLRIYGHNGATWADAGATLNTTANTLELTSLSSDSVYALMGNQTFYTEDVYGCVEITASGYYLVQSDIAAFSLLSLDQSQAPYGCIIISADNVTLDCQGHTLSTTSADAAFVAVNGSIASPRDSVVVRDCVLAQGKYPMFANFMENGTLENITARDSGEDGIFLYNSYNVTLANSTSYDNSDDGIVVAESRNINILNNSIHGNSNTADSVGLRVTYPDTFVIEGNVFYGNSRDFQADSTTADSSTFEMRNSLFLPPSGAVVDYTNLSINDTMSPLEKSYYINYSVSPGSRPPGLYEFTDKFIDMNLSGSGFDPSIDSIVWHYLQSEVSSNFYNEASMGVWKWNGTWSDTGDTLDSANNELALTSHTPGSTYGIFAAYDDYEVGGCMELDQSRLYLLTDDLTGASVSATPRTGSTCLKITADNVVLDCDLHTVTGSAQPDPPLYGILTMDADNVTVRNCDVRGYTWGYFVDSTTNSLFEDNLGRSAYDSVFYLDEGSNHLTLRGNDVRRTSNGTYAYRVRADYTYMYDNIAQYPIGIWLQSATHGIFANNTLNYTSNSGYGFFNRLAYYNLVENNTIYNHLYGIYSEAGNSNNYTNNTVYDTGDVCINISHYSVSGSLLNRIRENTVSNCGTYGISLDTQANGNYIINNDISGVSTGILVEGNSDMNQITGHTIDSVTLKGIEIRDSTSYNTLISSNTITGIPTAISIISAAGTRVQNNIISGSSTNGIYVSGANLTNLSANHMYNNAHDVVFYTSSSTPTVYMDRMIFDNPAGNYQNYSNVSMADQLSSSSGYYVDWTANSSVPPFTSFNDMFVDITSTTGAVSIDSLSFRYKDSQEIGYDEAKLEIWKNNGSWYKLNSAVDLVNNNVSTTNVPPDGEFGVLEGLGSGCEDITVPGTYILNMDANGAPYPVTDINYVDYACFRIRSDNVLFDCDGYSISNTGSIANAAAIAIYGNLTEDYTNVTIQNCADISDYEIGIALHQTSGDIIRNVTVSSAVGDIAQTYGIWMYNTSDSQLYNLTIHDSDWYGIRTALGENNTFHDSHIYDNAYYGLYTTGGLSFSVYDNNLSNNGDSGLYFNNPLSEIYDNLVERNDGTGMQVQAATNNISGNTLRHNAGAGIYIYANYNNLTNNTAWNNTLAGFQVSYADDVTISDSTAYSNGYGIQSLAPYNFMVSDTHLYANGVDFTVMASSGGTNSLYVSNMTIDRDAGDFTRETRLYINDTLSELDESYSIDYAVSPGALPPFRNTFDNKYVNISGSGYATVSIDSIVWKWDDADIGGATESELELWKYNGSWSNTGATLDTGANELSLSAMNPQSIYGILEDATGGSETPVVGCVELDASGTYYLANDVDAASLLSYGPYDAPQGNISPSSVGDAFNIDYACIIINTSNVVLDCNGHYVDWILAPQIADSAAIALTPGSDNVIIQNCSRLSDFEFGLYSLGSSGVEVSNVTINHTGYGFFSARTRFSSTDCQNNLIENSIISEGGYLGQSYEPGAGVHYLGCHESTINNVTISGTGTGGTSYGNAVNLEDTRNATLSNVKFYANDRDLVIESDLITLDSVNATDLYFLPPSGVYENYTHADHYDKFNASESPFKYHVSYFYVDPASLYPWMNSVDNKYLNITTLTPSYSGHKINSTTWHWTDAELAAGSYNESLFDIYQLKWPGGILDVSERNIAPDTGSNILVVQGSYYPESVFALMQDPTPITDCRDITESGSYRLADNLVGTQISKNKCIDILADDVVIDLNGYYIAQTSGDDGTGFGVFTHDHSGIKIYGSDGHVVGYGHGMLFDTSAGVNIDPLFLCNNTVGLLINNSNDTIVNDTIACNNSEVGIYILDSDNTTIYNSTVYNNTLDLKVNNTLGTPISLNMLSLIFDRPQGDNTSFTNMTISDSIAAGESYSVTWTANSSAIPATYTSFASKYVNITALSGSPSIDTAIWRWNTTELSGYGEDRFELWKYNGTWSDTGATLDTGANTLTVSSLNPASEYGILEASAYTALSDCAVISSPGLYTLGNNISGAPHYINPPNPSCYTWSNRYVCINVVASDVTIDCNGYTLTGDNSDGTTAAYGIYVGNDSGQLSNITIRNCNFLNWSQGGIYLDDVRDSEVYDNYLDSTRPGSRSQFAVYLNRNTNTTVRDNFAKNSSASLFETCVGTNNIFRNNTAYAGYVGFEIDRSNYTLVDGNNATLNTGSGYIVTTYQRIVVGNNLTNNYAYDTSSGTGFTINGQSDTYPNTYAYLANNTVPDAGSRDYYFNYMKNSTIENNTARLASQTGFYFDNNCEYNIIRDNIAENNTYNGFQFMNNFNYNNVTNNSARYSLYTSYQYNSGFNFFSTSGVAYGPRYNRLENNTAERNYYGIHMRGYFSNNTFIGNNLTNNDGYSFRMYRNVLGNTDSVFINNFMTDTLNDASDRAFDLYNSNNNTFTGNNMSNLLYGYYLSSSGSNKIDGGNLYNISSTAYYIVSASNNRVSNQSLSLGNTGFRVGSSCYNNSIHDSEIYDMTNYAVYISGGDNSTVSNVTAGGSNVYGFYTTSANNTLIKDSHVYDCATGAYISLSTNYRFNMSNVTFDSAPGNFENYTKLSIYDTVPALTRYTVNWTGEPPSPPKASFEQKFVNITTVTGTPAIDEVVWHWDESELTGHDEGNFELWKYNASGWDNTGATPNTVANTLTLTNMNPASDYGILEGTPGACMDITSPGSYQLTSNLEGAPISATPLSGTACIRIASSNVDFDCDGHTITNNGTAGVTFGIVSVGTLTNVTVRNCVVSQYYNGITFHRTSHSYLINNTAYNASFHFGFQINETSTDNVIYNNTAYNNSGYGFYFFRTCDRNNISHNTAYYNKWSTEYYFGGCDDNIIENNTAPVGTGGARGFYIDSSVRNRFNNNSVSNRGWEGFYLTLSSSYNNFTNNNVTNALRAGFYAQSNSGNLVFINNTVTGTNPLNAASGFDMRVNNVLIENNTVSGQPSVLNSFAGGFYFNSANSVTLRNNHVYNSTPALRYRAFGGPFTINVTDLVVDNPLGNYQNYTNISLNDSSTYSGIWEYLINWSDAPSTLPADHVSFENKYTNITNVSGNYSIDSIVWHWDDSELTGYDESAFELWGHNGSWSDAGATLDTGANTLTLSDFTNSSTLGILEYTPSALANCPNITAPGTYTMTTDFYGAPNPASELGFGTHMACVKIASSDVVFDCDGHTIYENNTSDTILTYGILANGTSSSPFVQLTNVTVKNCIINEYYMGILLKNTKYGSQAINNTIANSTGPSFYAHYGIQIQAYNFSDLMGQNSYSGNTVYNIDGFGISSYGAGNSTFTGNNVSNITANCFNIGDDYQTLNDNLAYDCGTGSDTAGFLLSGNNDSLFNNTAHSNNGSGFISKTFVSDSNLTLNHAYNNTLHGFEFVSVDRFSIWNNTAEDNGGNGYYFHSGGVGSDNYLFNNTAYNNSMNGFVLEFDPHNVLEFNNASYNLLSGYLLNMSYECNLSNNTALWNAQYGYSLIYGEIPFSPYSNGSNNNRLIDNNGTRNLRGISVFNSSNNLLENNLLAMNGQSGINLLNGTENTTLLNNTAHSGSFGLLIENATNTTIDTLRMYDNRFGDFSIDNDLASAITYNMTNGLFLSWLGTLVNYTNLSVNDSAEAGTQYTITWTTNASILPANHVSFEQKFVDITNNTGSPSIDSIVWHWTDAEAGGYDESRLELWKDNGTWSDTGATLNTGTNTLSLTNMNPASDYGILEDTSISNNITECLLISAPGSYQLTADLVGAPIGASEAVYLNWACIKIASGDVHIDCNGHTITNNGTADAGAIVANTSASVSYTNISLRNCPSIADYEVGVHAQYLESSVLDNLVVTNTTDGSFTGFGFLLSYSVDTNVTDNTISDSIGYGMRLRGGERNIISGNEISGSGYSNFEIGSTDGLVSGNTAHGGGTGFTFISGTNNTISDNLAYNNTYSGFDTNTANSQFINNTARENRDGFDISGTFNSNFTNSSSYNNTGNGFYISEADEINLDNFHLYANEYDLHWYAYNGVEDVYARNVSFDNPQGGFANYTRLDFNASLDGSIQDREVSFNWTTNTSALPLNYTSFEQKFVSIVNYTDGVTIDSIAWRWYDSESLIYNESRFQLWNWNGTGWSDTGATLDTGANSLSLSSMNPAGVYGILQNGSIGQEATLVGAEVNETKHGRYNESSYAGNASTSGGNFTNLNMNTSQLSERWAALYGTFDSTILLSDTAGINNVYSWIWNATAGGVVCVSTNDSLYNFTVFPATAGDIDSAWSFTPTASDSAANTFTGSNCTLDIGTTSIPDSAYADTGSAGGYITCAVKTKPVPTKPNLAFCAEIEEDGPIWNGDSGDFEIIVPTPIGIGSTETYFFYVNLN